MYDHPTDKEPVVKRTNGSFLHSYLEAANRTSKEVLEEDPIALDLIEKCDDLIAHLVSTDQSKLGLVGHALALNAYFLFMASVRTAISGHPGAVHSTLRSALEHACYAFLIVEDEQRVEVWLKRNVDKAGNKEQRATFGQAVHRASTEMEKYDPETASRIKALYDAAIDFGAHPNPKSVLAHLTVDSTQSSDAQVLTCLYPWSQETGRGLLACLEFGIAIISILVITKTKCPPLQMTNPELFDLMIRRNDVAVQHYGLKVENGRVIYNAF